jgi:SAM-dependent methyltransferase
VTPEQSRHDPHTSSEPTLQARSERIAQAIFLGGPPRDFEEVGRLCLDVLLREGLRPSSRVLDVGCGALRVGYWLMRFLDPGCYFGIEPNREMLNVGLQEIVEPEVLARAQPRFDHNDRFDFSVFGERFDFVLARSIWTHAAKAQISAMLASFATSAAPGGVLLATYHPASAVFSHRPRSRAFRRLWTRTATSLPLAELSPLLAALPAIGRARDYGGERWVGVSHESQDPGVVQHSLRWITDAAREHGLSTRLMPYPIVNDQYWLRVAR